MRKLILSWERYISLHQKLAARIKQKPGIIVCISRGGLIPGLLLSKLLKVPLAVISAKGYDGSKKRSRISVCPSIASTAKVRGRILLVDDVADSGRTFLLLKKLLSKKGSVQTAAIFHKRHSLFKPDYFAAECEGSDWIVFPYDQF